MCSPAFLVRANTRIGSQPIVPFDGGRRCQLQSCGPHQGRPSGTNAEDFSREAAAECSPGRKPWVQWITTEPQRGERAVRTQTQQQRGGPTAPYVSSEGKTILGWNNVPATRVAMAISSLCPAKTFTCRARESSGRLTGRPLRMRAAVGSSAVTDGS